MNPLPLSELIRDAARCQSWLSETGVTDPVGAWNQLQSLWLDGPLKSPERLNWLGMTLPRISDPDRGLQNLAKFLSVQPALDRELFQRAEQLNLQGLMTLFSDSQYLSDFLIQNPEKIECLIQTDGQLRSREALVDELRTQLVDVTQSREAMSLIRDFKLTQTARIAIGDLVERQRLANVAQQISLLAEAICESGYDWAFQQLERRWGKPAQPARGSTGSGMVILALGKLGGSELNYSSDIDWVMVYRSEGFTEGAHPKTNREFYQQLAHDMVRLLSESTNQGIAYRVDLRLRPEGSRGRICCSLKSALHYYDFQGRTWERQALIKARPIAGDLGLGTELLSKLHPWIYRDKLNREDITGIKALKRRIERRAISKGTQHTDIKTGHGGIRDIEFVIQFLQLLNAGVLPEIQTPNTLIAIERLELAKCLTTAEGTLLTRNYIWLRKLEHRLQLMFDLQVHSLPIDQQELLHVARRMGFRGADALSRFRHELAQVTTSNRTILNHLLHDAFGMTYGSLRDSGGHLVFASDPVVPAEVDLVLEPEPDPQMISAVLQPHGFTDVSRAFENLMELSKEKTPFLSPRRCHHFLAAVAPRLLHEISQTPDPDATLAALAAVSDSLGAKGVLWELFSFNPPTLSLYVQLCATSDYLAGILKSNPGMIDELLDSLQVESLPSFEFLQSSLNELVKGAEDIEPIVHSFKNAQHLRVGIRDILGRDEVRRIHEMLSDIAESCLVTVTMHEFLKLMARHSPSGYRPWPELGESIPFVILGLGKLGGKEPNYHSDLDVIFLYQHDPKFEATLNDGVSSQFFFSELAANISRFFNDSKRFGRLYELDSRLRPTGKNGPLAVSCDEFGRYFESGEGWLWERQALCKARPVFGSAELRADIQRRVQTAIGSQPWQPAMAEEIMRSRDSIQQSCRPVNLKKGQGGTIDVEFAIQALQLKHASSCLSLETGTLNAIEALMEQGHLDRNVGHDLAAGYQLLRSVEARLRLINTTARHDFPEDPMALEKLAFLLGIESSQRLCDTVNEARQNIRQRYLEVFSGLLRQQ